MPLYGINLDPDNHAGLPPDPASLRGLQWVRFVFQASPHQPRTLQQSCALYAPLIDRYHALGVQTLLVLNHQMFIGGEPWKTGGGWVEYASQFSARCGEVAAYFKGKGIAYEIWNEEDQASESAIYLPPSVYAPLLKASAAAIKAADPDARVVFGGLVSGDPCGYLQAVHNLIGALPVDAIGIHPYGKSPDGANGIVPFLKTVADAFDLPLWLTEFGDGAVVADRYAAISYYLRTIDAVLRKSLPKAAPVAIWYCWSDGMNPGFGITDANCQPKEAVYSALYFVASLNAPVTPPPTVPSLPLPVTPPTQSEGASGETQTFTHQQLINAIYEAAQALGENPWRWFTAASLNYLTKDRDKIYTGTPIDDLGGLTPEKKALIKQSLAGKPLETVVFGGGALPDDSGAIPPAPPVTTLPAQKVLDIQWVTQIGYGANDCGDACVLMLLWYYGITTPSPKIVYSRLYGKTTADELVYLANLYDLNLTTESAALDRLPELIALNKPVILLVDYKMLGFPVHLASGVNQGYHWFLVVGYNATGFVIHDPLWLPTQRDGKGGAYLTIDREKLRGAMVSNYVMLYRADK